ncbi:capsular polysaccharide biosynthesis protein-like protein [Natronobacterium gregoryi SP2]|uniref:Capsular polysaccharide biosynthesis protein-like protein n=1 Tax=Natronobacterium gregoryi (strain ATCC 43098 / DSM 3393 / CCM 3738 / CIP 104747 / IAM 13177 / JCM 8860 / NBRC 102187 / NCIMB 2189 / SP2) TaxID=797304 RepID=L9Y4M2_NATGS|nr:capsular polysaccharide biosynthesis protein-like protein [Natronobacterium gregoryi SP2]
MLSEASTRIFESTVTRALVRRLLLDDQSVFEQPQLREVTSQHWESDPQNTFNPFQSKVQIPGKSRLETSGSFANNETYLPPEPFVAELPNATVLAPTGVALTEDSRFVKDIVAPHRSSNSRLEKLLARSLRYNGYRDIRNAVSGSDVSPDRCLSLATVLVPTWHNYYHWTLECLPRLLGVETYRKHTNETPTILLPSDPPSWMRESLELVDVDDLEIEEIRSEIIDVDRLVVPSYPSPSRTECHWLRNRIHDGLDDRELDGESHDRVYVTRRNATVRRVKDEQRLYSVFDKYDMQPYALEALTIAEQANLFAEAELVVSPHGAGLANLVYASSPTVLELFGDKEKTTFYRLAKLMGFEYHAMFCDHDKKDIVVDPDRLDDAIGSVLSGDRDPVIEGRRPGSE